MIVEGYSMHVYCENSQTVTGERNLDHDYTNDKGFEQMIDLAGRNRTECLREAKQRGWKIRKNKAWCPGCQ